MSLVELSVIDDDDDDDDDDDLQEKMIDKCVDKV